MLIVVGAHLFFFSSKGEIPLANKIIFDSYIMYGLNHNLAKIDSKDRKMFAELDGELRFCCYSLLLETAKGIFEIQE